MKIEELVRKNIRDLTPYSSAMDDYQGSVNIKLDANENPFESDLNRYPDPYQKDLKSKISKLKGVSQENLFIGNGSDEIIDLIFRAFCEPNRDRALGFEPSYGMYKVSADINAVRYDTISLNEDFSLSADKLLAAVTENTKVIFVCSPNNPTGNVLNKNELEKVLNQFKGILVIDEAYMDFSNQNSWIKDLYRYPQLIVLQTLSKSYGLAGLRIGIGYCSDEIVQVLNKIKPPYNVNSFSQKAAIKGLENQADYKGQLNLIIKERERLIDFLKAIPDVLAVYPTETNFILVKFKEAKKVYNYLIADGIIVRDRSNMPGCAGCLRISVGTPAENKVIINKLMEYKA